VKLQEAILVKKIIAIIRIDKSERKLLSIMNSYGAFFRRDKKVILAENFEIPEEFPIYLNRVMEIFTQ